MFNYRLQLLLLSLLATVYCQSSDSDESCDSNESGGSDDDSHHSDEDSHHSDDDSNHHHHHKPRFVCPKGWQYSDRIRSPWCIKVFPSVVQPRGISRQSAEDSCANENAVLSGIENAQESVWIQRQTLQIFQNASLVSGSVWIGGARRVECIGPANKNLPGCLPQANNAFEWTDHHTIGKSGFVWASYEPDYLEADQVFVCMFVIGGYDPALRPGTVSGSMDDVGSLPYLAPQPFVTVRAFACGKPATQRN